MHKLLYMSIFKQFYSILTPFYVILDKYELYIQKQEIISIEGIHIKTTHAKKVELEYLADL